MDNLFPVRGAGEEIYEIAGRTCGMDLNGIDEVDDRANVR